MPGRNILDVILLLLLVGSIINLMFMVGIFDKTLYIELLERYVAPDNFIEYPFRALLKIEVVLIFLFLMNRCISLLIKSDISLPKSGYLLVLWIIASWLYMQILHAREDPGILVSLLTAIVYVSILLLMSSGWKERRMRIVLALSFTFLLFHNLPNIQIVVLFLVGIGQLSVLLTARRWDGDELRVKLPYFAVFCLFATWFFIGPKAGVLYYEDRLFESLTAAVFIFTGVIFLAAFFKARGASTLAKSVLIILFVSFLILGLEEISWGQRIFSLETPESVKEWNRQDELNLHNLFNKYMTLAYRTVVGTVAVILLYGRELVEIMKRANLFQRLLPLVPPSNFVFFGIILNFLFLYSLCIGGWYTELVEETLSVISLTYAISIYTRL